MAGSSASEGAGVADQSRTVAQRPYAAIDVGTNSVKLIVADLGDGRADRIFETTENTRLGEGMRAHMGRLREVPMLRTLDAIESFVQTAKDFGALGLVAVGTAALRDAGNSDEFLNRVRERCGLAIEVILGSEEARLSYLAVRRDPFWRSSARLIVIDIGGGSTEVILGEPNTQEIAGRISVNLGAVKLTEACLKSDPVTVAQLGEANAAAAAAFEDAPFFGAARADIDTYTVVGVGGTMTNLSAIRRGGRGEDESVHGTVVRASDLEAQIALLASKTVVERMEIPGLDPRRADIILGGAILLSQALARIGSNEIAVSSRGLRWGLLYDRFTK